MANGYKNRVLSAAAQIREELSKHNHEIRKHTERATQLQTALDALIGGNSPTSNSTSKTKSNGHTPWWQSLSTEQRAVIVAKRNATRAETRARKAQQGSN